MTQDTPETVKRMVETFRQKFTSFKKGRGHTGEGSGHVLSPKVWAHEATDFLTTHATTLVNDAVREERERMLKLIESLQLTSAMPHRLRINPSAWMFGEDIVKNVKKKLIEAITPPTDNPKSV